MKLRTDPSTLSRLLTRARTRDTFVKCYTVKDLLVMDLADALAVIAELQRANQAWEAQAKGKP